MQVQPLWLIDLFDLTIDILMILLLNFLEYNLNLDYYIYLLKDKLLNNRNWFRKLFAHYLYFDLDINYYKDIVHCFNLFNKEILKSRDIYKEIYKEASGLEPRMLIHKIFSNSYFNASVVNIFEIVKYFFENISDDFYYLDSNSTKEEIIEIIKKDPISIFNINEDLRQDKDILLTLFNLYDEDGIISLLANIYISLYGSYELLIDNDVIDSYNKLNSCNRRF